MLTENTTLRALAVIFCTLTLIILHGGFLCLKSGQARSKNSTHVAMRSLIDFGLCVLIFYFVGYSLIYGKSVSGLYGEIFTFKIIHKESLLNVAFYFFHAIFSVMAVSIYSGSVSERMGFKAYICMVLFTALVTYPLYAHWTWNGIGPYSNTDGWLHEMGFIDFAGSTTVHSLGAWIAVTSIRSLGKKAYENEITTPLRASNLPFAVLGVFLLWAGWFGIHMGFALFRNIPLSNILVNTLLAGAAGMILSLVAGWITRLTVRVDFVINGTVAGLVSIAASAHIVPASSAFFIGSVGGVVMIMTKFIIERYVVDDSVEVTAAFLAPGIWGTIAVAIFANAELLEITNTKKPFLIVQIIGVVVCAIWACGLTFIFLKFLKLFFSINISKEDEQIGLDKAELSESHALMDLYHTMDMQINTGDLGVRANVDPYSEVGNIAERYNQVMASLEKMNQEIHKKELESSIQKQLTVDAISSAKLASIGELAAGVAHEINNPLNGMINYAQLAIENAGQQEKEYLEELISEGKRIAGIVENLLDYSRQNEEQITEISSIEVFYSAMQLMKNQLKRDGTKVIKNNDSIIPPVIFKTGELKQIFINIISNANHALNVKYPKFHEDKTITLDFFHKDSKVYIEISDNGTGMGEKTLSKIFTPFYTTKQKGQGTGLGLPICHKLMTKNKGQIKVESKLNQGTKFTLILPVKNNG
jgi:ammonium transporter, Amt family